MGQVFGSLFGKEETIQAFLSQEELEEVKIGSCLTRKEIEKLYDRFSKEAQTRDRSVCTMQSDSSAAPPRAPFGPRESRC